jgi:hypothetical protein
MTDRSSIRRNAGNLYEATAPVNNKGRPDLRPGWRIEQAGMRPPGIVGGREAFSQDSQPRRNPGRPKGSPNKMGHNLMELVMQAAEETGFVRKDEKGEIIGTGEEGVKGYLKWAALHKSERFLALMARLAPKQVFADVTHHDAVMTREEVEAEMRERGIPVELLNSIMKAPVELDWDEDPDPYGLMKNVTPVSTNGGGTEGNGTDGGA